MKKVIIILILFLLFLFTKQILNLFLNINIIKEFFFGNLIEYLKNIELKDKEFDVGYMTTIYDLNIHFNILNAKDYSISFSKLNDISLNLNNINGQLRFHFYTGANYYLSVGDEITIEFEIDYLNYKINVNYNPLNILDKNYSFRIKYSVESEKMIHNYFVQKGVKHFKDNINKEIKNHFENLPNIIKPYLTHINKKYNTLFSMAHLYSSLYNIIAKAFLIYYF